jgi:hypothetical protein
MPRHANGRDFSIAELERMLKTRRSKVAALDRTRAKLQKRLDTIGAKILALGGSASSGGTRAKNKVGLNDSIEGLLRKKGDAMSVGDIVSGVLAAGYNSKSANFRGIVNQALIKDKRFVKAGSRGLYQLKK